MADFSALQTFAGQDTKQLPMYQDLVNMLKGGYTGGLPYKDQLLQTTTGAINKQYNKASSNLADTLSAKGLGKSGIEVAAQGNLAGEQSTALNTATANLNQEDIQYRNQAIMNLLGLNTAEGGYEGQQSQQKLSALGEILGGQISEDKLKAEEEQSNTDIWSKLLGAGGQLLTAPVSGGGSVLTNLLGLGKKTG
jgi:hypothetical protein